MSFELSIDPDLLFNTAIPTTNLTLFGHKLYEDATHITIADITDTSMHALPEGITRSAYQHGKVYYEDNGEMVEYLLHERIASVVYDGGWLHMRSGIRYRVQDHTVVEIRIDGEPLKYYQRIEKSEIENTFGKPDRIKETYDPYDDTLFRTDFVYRQRMMRIFFDDWHKRIDGINLGEALTNYDE
jgi:hypothetical protein